MIFAQLLGSDCLKRDYGLFNSLRRGVVQHDLPVTISAPVLRALLGAKITSLAKLARLREADVLKLHGIGPTALPKLRRALKAKKLEFKP